MNVNEIINKIGGSSLTVNDVISGGITLFLGIIAVGAFASLIYSGFVYITAGGDVSKTEKARKNILWAIIGIILAVSSYVLVQLVTSVFDSNNPASQPAANQEEQSQQNTAEQNPTPPPVEGDNGPVDNTIE
jgi:hypothetical protein